MTQPIITLSAIQKYYGDYHALRDVTLDIAEGEFFSLLGPSGCGKTTLLRTIAGFEEATSGDLMLDGANMARVPPNKRPTNMVFQSYAIFPHLNVAENVAFGLRKHSASASEKAAMVDEALAMVGLTGFEKRAAHELSGGQRQRVALARALVLKPKVLLLDEPTVGLDAASRAAITDYVHTLADDGMTVLWATHLTDEIRQDDNLLILHQGQVLANDVARNVTGDRPLKEYFLRVTGGDKA